MSPSIERDPASTVRDLLRLCLPLALAAILLLLGLGLAAAQGPTRLTRITTASDSDRDSRSASISGDGSRVAFYSDSDFLGEGRPDDVVEIWLYDTTTMTFTRVTSASDSDRNSYSPSISGDGTRVAFESDSDFLGQGITDTQNEIWLYDTATMTLTRVTTTSGTGYRGNEHPSLNADGTKVAFDGNCDFLGQGITDTQNEIWLYDTATMTVTRVTSASDSDRRSTSSSLSADGKRIAFSSDSDFLGEGRLEDVDEIWLYDTATMTVTRVTSASNDNRESHGPSLSADGKRVAFFSDSDFLGQGILLMQDEIWLYDTTTMALTRVTVASGSNRDSSSPSVNADGSRVAFQSDSDLLNQGIMDNQTEIWLYDTATMTFTRVTTSSGGANRDSVLPSLSVDRTAVAFHSDSDFMSQDIPRYQYEIWLWEGLPGLGLTKAVDDDTPAPGQRITYTVSIINSGLGDATGAVVSDTLDERLGFIGPVTLDPPGAGTVSTRPLLATDLTINAGGRITLTVPVMVTTTGVTSGTVIANTAAVTSTEVSTPATGSVSVTIGPAGVYLPVVLRSGS